MADSRPPIAAALLRRLSRLSTLTPEEIDQICDLAPLRRRWRAGTILLGEGREPVAHFVLSGWACSQRVLRDGRRQIFDFILPGEGFGFGSLADAQARQAVIAVTPVETVDASALLRAAQALPDGGLWRSIRASELEADARRLEHMVRLGRLAAPEKTAHFILEMQRRAGAAEAQTFPLPLTQEAMGDALGISVVHLNRVLRQFRADGVLELRGGMAHVRDAKALATAAILTPVGAELAAAR